MATSSSAAAAAAAAAAMMAKGPPYLPATAGLGGTPTKTLDDPITSVFLVLFVIGAVCHMTILQVNAHRGKRFIMSGLLFGFCMARITACTMRLVWSTHVTNINVAIAAQIFVAAGVLLLFIVNLIFTQRILRASHPDWAWSKPVSIIFKIYYTSIPMILVVLITCTVQSFFTLNPGIRRSDRYAQRFGATYFAVAAFLPIPLVLARLVLPSQRPEKFGEGRFRTKIFILLFSSTILTLGAAFRAGTAYLPRPRADPAWYHSKACFYIFNFTVEIIVVYLYIFLRVDKRFWIPNGSSKTGNYSGGEEAKGEEEDGGRVQRKKSLVDRVLTEEQVFDLHGEETELEEEQKTGSIELLARDKGHEAGARAGAGAEGGAGDVQTETKIARKS